MNDVSQNVRLRVSPMLFFAAMVAAAMLAGLGEASARTKTPPYWASLSVDEARMRVGPSLDYPSTWVYRRRDLPVRVVQVLSNWRKIEDPSGTQGWMHVRLLSDAPTAMVIARKGEMYRDRSTESPLLYRAETAVVGQVGGCKDGWCLFTVGKRRGYIQASSLWGATN